MNDLWDELVIVEILSRLPSSQSVVKCKAVCKHWLHLISSDYFIHQFILQHRLNRSYPSFGMVIRPQYDKTWNSMILLSRPEDDELDFSDRFLPDHLMTRNIPNQKSPRLVVIGIYNDLLLCFDHKKVRNLYICNFETKEWLALPSRPYRYKEFLAALVINDAGDSHCFRVVECIPYFYEHTKFQGNIFSSETQKWDELVISSPKQFEFSKFYGSSIVNNGMVYFYDEHFKGMIALNPFIDVIANVVDCHFVDFPQLEEDLSLSLVLSKVGICQGRIRISRIPLGAKSLSIWDLKDYRTSDWSWQYNVDLNDLVAFDPYIGSLLYGFLSVIGFHPFCEYKVYVQLMNHIVLCDLKTRRLEQVFEVAQEIAFNDDGIRKLCSLWLWPQCWPTPLLKCPK